MPAIVLLLPFLLIRFGLLSMLSQTALARAAHFAPMTGAEKAAYYIYQITNLAILGSAFFLKTRFNLSLLFWVSAALYGLGLVLCAAAVYSFAGSGSETFSRRGLYQFSRHPMYIAYFICFIGIAGLTQSLLFLLLVLIFQISAHWIILAEERECLARFGDAYRTYSSEVRRYL